MCTVRLFMHLSSTVFQVLGLFHCTASNLLVMVWQWKRSEGRLGTWFVGRFIFTEGAKCISIDIQKTLKAAKYEVQKPSTWRATLFRCKFGSTSPVFHLAWSTCRATKTFVAGWRKLLRKLESGSTLSNKFWLCCSFFIKLTTCRATNVLLY